MGRSFLKNNWQIIFLNLIILTVFTVFYGHFGDVNVDSFREAYVPAQVLGGEVLYKNIFTIYAPFSYLFNALLYKIFGVNLAVLYFAGLLATVGIANLLYKIANMFLDKLSSFAIVLFLISASVLSPNVFSFFFPYSYGVLYGTLFILGALYFALKDKMPFAYLMYSFAVCSKYEFLLLLPLLIFYSEKKDWWKYLLGLILPVLLTLTPLFCQKVGLENLIASFQIISTISATKTLYWFYSVMGLVFRWELIPIYIANLAKVLIPAVFLYYFRTWWLILILIVYFYFIVSPEILIYAFPLILGLFAYRFKKLDEEKRFLALACMLISMKVFFALTLKSYGVFFVPFALLAIFVLVRKRYRLTLAIITLICSGVLYIQNSVELLNKRIQIKTERGVVYSDIYNGTSVNMLLDYVKENTSETDKIVVYPEGLIINFMGNRNSDNKFYSLIPLYVETFGDELVISRLERIKPEYIVISNYDTSNYYYSYFGQDYANFVFDYVIKNYTKQTSIGNKLTYTVFKRKN